MAGFAVLSRCAFTATSDINAPFSPMEKPPANKPCLQTSNKVYLYCVASIINWNLATSQKICHLLWQNFVLEIDIFKSNFTASCYILLPCTCSDYVCIFCSSFSEWCLGWIMQKVSSDGADNSMTTLIWDRQVYFNWMLISFLSQRVSGGIFLKIDIAKQNQLIQRETTPVISLFLNHIIGFCFLHRTRVLCNIYFNPLSQRSTNCFWAWRNAIRLHIPHLY